MTLLSRRRFEGDEDIYLQERQFYADSQLVASVGWNAANEVHSCSDDHSIWRWNKNGEPVKMLGCWDATFTKLECSSQWHRTGSGNDVFAVACTDGTFRIVNKSGKEERRVEAHEGAVICLRWNHEGTALATGGEDGVVKIWSRNGMLRSSLAQTSSPVYALAWSPDSDQILYSCNRRLIIKPQQSSSKESQWEAHEGLILCIDWNPVNRLIISGGEDCIYKVWDCYGRLMYQCTKSDSSITSVAWCLSGELFAVGTFDAFSLCDKTGWMLWKEKASMGSVLSLSWSMDGTQLVAAGGNGTVLFGQIVERRVEWMKLSATLQDFSRICVHDTMNDREDEINFRDRVMKLCLGFKFLIVATATQCYVYSTSNLKAPHIMELKDSAMLMKQCQRYFMIVDYTTGLQLFTYDGRHLSNPKCQGLRAEGLNDQNICISNDCVAFIDSGDHRMLRFLDATTGKVVGDVICHALEITEIALNQAGTNNERKIIFIDRNQDLYMSPVYRQQVFKLATIVDKACWNSEADMLAAIAEQKIMIWYYPHAAYIDKDLLYRVKVIRECDLGKNPKIQSFVSSQCLLRRTDGATIATYVCPYPFVLFQHIRAKQWDHAIRLCRFVKEDLLWACLAAMAVNAEQLTIAEEAYAALDEIDKVQFMLYLKDLALEEVRVAELALFKRKPEEAEGIFLQAGLIYRAIHMNLKIFNWDRALELAVMHKVHIDTVMWYRQHYLLRIKSEENKEQFLHLKDQVKIDPQKINSKIQQEMTQENNRAAKRV